MSNLHTTDTIVVGIDGSELSNRALEWALDEAQAHGKKLVLVHGVELGLSVAEPYGGGYVYEQLAETGRLVLAEAEAVAAARGVPVESRLETGPPAYALVEASKHADLVVVGSRGHGGFVGLLLGSVSASCVHHAHCPVVVIRPPDKTSH